MFSPKSPRAKFCSEACKQKNKRKQTAELAEKGLPPTIQASEIESPQASESDNETSTTNASLGKDESLVEPSSLGCIHLDQGKMRPFTCECGFRVEKD